MEIKVYKMFLFGVEGVTEREWGSFIVGVLFRPTKGQECHST